MTRDELRTAFLEEICAIAPEADLADVEEVTDIRELFDLDSMDVFNLLAALHERLGIDIPDKDAPRLLTIADAVDYLAISVQG